MSSTTVATYGSPAFWMTVAERSQVTVYTTLAAWTWLIYDWVSTFDDEVNFVWLSKWSMSKCLYIITRYFGVFLLTVEATSELSSWDQEFCSFYFTIVAIGTAITLFLVEIGMQFRVYALYNGSKKVLYINGAIFLIEVAAVSTLIGIERTHHLNIVPAPPFLAGCWNTEKPHLLLASWFIALAYELYLFLFVAYKALMRWKEEGRLMGMFSLMFRDAVLWFVFIGALLAWNAFSFFIAQHGYIFLGLPFIHAASSIGGSRMMVDLRKAWEDGSHQTSVYVVPQQPPPPPSSASGSASVIRSLTNTIRQTIGLRQTQSRTPHKLDSDWCAFDSNSSDAELVAMEELRNMSRGKRSPTLRRLSTRLCTKWFGGSGRVKREEMSPQEQTSSWVRGAEFAMQLEEMRLPPPPVLPTTLQRPPPSASRGV